MVILAFLTKGVKVLKPAVFIVMTSVFAMAQDTFIRINQAGYLPSEPKVALVISKTPVSHDFTVVRNQDGKVVVKGRLRETPAGDWGGKFTYFYLIDFSKLK